MTDPVIIVGASMGGLRVAEALRRAGYTGPITAFGDEPYPPYNRPPLSKEVLASDVSLEAVQFPQRDATADVNWVLNTRIERADLASNSLTDEHGHSHTFSTLIIATGIRSKRAEWANPVMAGRHAVRSLDDAIALRAALNPGTKVVVYGAGFIGCETAATARKLGCDVTIVAPGVEPIARYLGLEFAQWIRAAHDAHGVQFRMQSRIDNTIGDDHITGVVLDDGTTLDCDVLIEAIGSIPNVEWLAGNDLDLSDGVLTNTAMQAVRTDGTVVTTVFALGDVARFPNALFDDEPRRVEHWNIPTDTAKRVAEVAAAQLAQSDSVDELVAKRFAPVPSFWSDQYDIHMLAYGIVGLADRSELLHNTFDDDEFCVGYYRGDELVGVCGVGMRNVVMGYRAKVGTSA